MWVTNKLVKHSLFDEKEEDKQQHKTKAFAGDLH